MTPPEPDSTLKHTINDDNELRGCYQHGRVYFAMDVRNIDIRYGIRAVNSNQTMGKSR